VAVGNESSVYSGDFRVLAAYSGVASTTALKGAAHLIVGRTSAQTGLRIEGAIEFAGQSLKAHLHARPCRENGGQLNERQYLSGGSFS